MKTATPMIILYTKVLAVLLLLTLLTFIQPSFLHLSPGKTAGVQLLIAAIKIGILVAYYMHLRSEKAYLKKYVFMVLLLLLIFFVIVGTDVVHS